MPPLKHFLKTFLYSMVYYYITERNMAVLPFDRAITVPVIIQTFITNCLAWLTL
jgi:hypothetical protein